MELEQVNTRSSSDMIGRPRLILADDHQMVLDSLQAILQDQFEIAAFIRDGQDLLARVLDLQPAVVILDVAMPGLSGFDAARQLTASAAGVKIIFVTVHLEPAYIREALAAGADGYISKGAAAAELVEGIWSVLRGEKYLDSVTKRIMQSEPEEPFPLSVRQREVLRLIAKGMTAKEIATQLSLSVRTAEFHRATLMDKLKLRSTAQLTRYAIEHGLV
jgi:DNA-binding NarL/FixJ family response regulator